MTLPIKFGKAAIEKVMEVFGISKKDAAKRLTSKFNRIKAEGFGKGITAGYVLSELLGIKKANTPTLNNTASAADKSKKTSDIEKPVSKPKTYRTVGGYRLTEQQYLKYLDQGKDYLDNIKNTLKKVKKNSGNKGMLVGKKRTGHTDYRKGGMVIK